MFAESLDPTRGIARVHSQHNRHRGTGRFARCTVALLLAFGMLAAPSLAQAQDGSRYTSARKLGRGFSNTLLGILAIPGEMMSEIDQRGPYVGSLTGFGLGLGMFVAHEVVGVYEIISCPFEAPPKFRPILDPEFPWQYFDGRASSGGGGA